MTIAFDEHGVCSACRVAEQKKNIDWASREEELRELSRKWADFPGPHNILVPGSGGKDSFYQAHQLKFRFGFRPLTVTWAPHLYTDWGRQNHDAWISAGFDNILVTPNRQVHRLLTRLAVDKLFHPFQPFMIGQKNLAPLLANQFGIPLVFYGENEAEYGNPAADASSAQRDTSFFSGKNLDEILLSGVEVSRLKTDFGLGADDLAFYLPLEPDFIERAGIEVHYLGYYLPWHPQGAYYYAVEHGGFTPSPERTPGLSCNR
jgi:N-acetyl sugar amidotransferase